MSPECMSQSVIRSFARSSLYGRSLDSVHWKVAAALLGEIKRVQDPGEGICGSSSVV